jgi:hypothetical protein
MLSIGSHGHRQLLDAALRIADIVSSRYSDGRSQDGWRVPFRQPKSKQSSGNVQSISTTVYAGGGVWLNGLGDSDRAEVGKNSLEAKRKYRCSGIRTSMSTPCQRKALLLSTIMHRFGTVLTSV